jgi:anthranilate synthase/aminodeoxychorismate synthase-like glutamine amidotransferase
MGMNVLVVDNYDSFTYNLVQYLGELGAEIEVVRNDRATVDDLLAREPERVVVSPGPCTPDDAGISLEVVRRFPEAGVPTLGVCLGHQAMAQAFGGRVTRGEPVHGKTTTVEHDGRTIYDGLPSPLTAGRYHSLIVDPDLPDCFERTAEGGGVVMGIRHRELPAEGVQFHPESVLTEGGKALLANFLRAGPPPAGASAAREPLDVVRAWIDGFNNGGDTPELVHPDFEMTEAAELPGAVHVRGLDELLRYMRGLERNWSSFRWEPRDLEANGERVWMSARLVVTGRQSGVDVDRVWQYVFTVRDGLMLRQDGFDDEAEARRAAGLDT